MLDRHRHLKFDRYPCRQWLRHSSEMVMITSEITCQWSTNCQYTFNKDIYVHVYNVSCQWTSYFPHMDGLDVCGANPVVVVSQVEVHCRLHHFNIDNMDPDHWEPAVHWWSHHVWVLTIAALWNTCPACMSIYNRYVLHIRISIPEQVHTDIKLTSIRWLIVMNGALIGLWL